jgi:hypothetical protein
LEKVSRHLKKNERVAHKKKKLPFFFRWQKKGNLTCWQVTKLLKKHFCFATENHYLLFKNNFFGHLKLGSFFVSVLLDKSNFWFQNGSFAGKSS